MKEHPDHCVFCKILKKTLPVSLVHEDEHCIAFMDIQPVNAGHVLVIPREHAPYLRDLDPVVGGHIFQIGMKINAALRKSPLRCEGVNFLLADGEAAMQEVFHIHLHVIPRFRQDGFGLRFGDNYFFPPSRKTLDDTASVIRNSL